MESPPPASGARPRDARMGETSTLERGDATDLDVERKRLRKSDPLPPSTCPSPPADQASSSTQRRASVGSTPRVTRMDSWEYPLSREEKKHRVMCLYQRELAEARAGVRKSTPSCEDKAPRPPPPEVGAALPSPPAAVAYGVVDGSPAVAADAAAGASPAPAKAMCGRPPQLAFVAVAALVVAAVGLGWRGLAPVGPSMSAASTPSGESVAAPIRRPPAPAASFPNATAHVTSLREQGLRWLRMSDCFKATWFLKSALKQIEEEQEELEAESVGAVHDERLAAFFAAQHDLLAGEHAFALVCSQRYDDGARALEHHISGLGSQRIPPYLLNALGFAHYHRRDYSASGDAFGQATEADPNNPILWNNLAAARMVVGDIRAADDALFRTLDSAAGKNCQFHVEEYHMRVFQYNVQNLATRARGKAASLPSVELWLPA